MSFNRETQSISADFTANTLTSLHTPANVAPPRARANKQILPPDTKPCDRSALMHNFQERPLPKAQPKPSQPAPHHMAHSHHTHAPTQSTHHATHHAVAPAQPAHASHHMSAHSIQPAHHVSTHSSQPAHNAHHMPANSSQPAHHTPHHMSAHSSQPAHTAHHMSAHSSQPAHHTPHHMSAHSSQPTHNASHAHHHSMAAQPSHHAPHTATPASHHAPHYSTYPSQSAYTAPTYTHQPDRMPASGHNPARVNTQPLLDPGMRAQAAPNQGQQPAHPTSAMHSQHAQHAHHVQHAQHVAYDHSRPPFQGVDSRRHPAVPIISKMQDSHSKQPTSIDGLPINTCPLPPDPGMASPVPNDRLNRGAACGARGEARGKNAQPAAVNLGSNVKQSGASFHQSANPKWAN